MQSIDLADISLYVQVPGLYPKDELATLLEVVAPAAKRAGRGATSQEVYSFFVEQCRKNLRVVLAMSPVRAQSSGQESHNYRGAAVLGGSGRFSHIAGRFLRLVVVRPHCGLPVYPHTHLSASLCVSLLFSLSLSLPLSVSLSLSLCLSVSLSLSA